VTVTVTLDPAHLAKRLTDETGDDISAEDVSRILSDIGEASIIEKLHEGLLDFLAESFT
jgi:hypothetical protein